ncbi:MAG: PQQ-binding-like beta-propeller repeat protein [Prolixibacteraceae bacterium]|jgi:outer membrane protein assembly factor BamB
MLPQRIHAKVKRIVFHVLLLISFQVSAQTHKSISDIRTLPNLYWTFSTGLPIYSWPVVNGNTIYVGGNDSILHVLDLNSGREKWRFQTKGEIRSSICLDSDKVVLNGGDGLIYAIDNATGGLVWTFRTGGERKYDFADYFHSSPILKNGVIYFGSGDGNFYAVNSSDGKLVWKFESGDIVHTTATISGDKIFFGSFDGYFYALNIATGKLIWKFKTVGQRYFPKGEVQGSPTIFGNMIIVGARDFNVYAIDQEKGFCHWNKSFTKGWGLCNTIHDSVLYIGTADERRLIAVNPATGTEFWNKPMEFLVFGNNAYSDSMLYIGTTIGKLHGISLVTGMKMWTFPTNAYLLARSKYFKPDDSYRDDIYSIIKSNEQFLEVEEELGGIFSAPAISGNKIIFTSTDGKIYCLTKQ